MQYKKERKEEREREKRKRKGRKKQSYPTKSKESKLLKKWMLIELQCGFFSSEHAQFLVDKCLVRVNALYNEWKNVLIRTLMGIVKNNYKLCTLCTLAFFFFFQLVNNSCSQSSRILERMLLSQTKFWPSSWVSFVKYAVLQGNNTGFILKENKILA